jgi:hypothetical protein
MIEIPLRNRAGIVIDHALIDDDDFDLVGNRTWCRKDGYAVAGILHPSGEILPNGKRKQALLRMHRLIIGLDFYDPREPDHINRIRSDNRRVNLRIGDRSQNNQNKSSRVGSTSRFRGVHRHSQSFKWVAQATLNGVKHHLGVFDTEEEANDVAVVWRREHMPFSDGS